ncbi:LytR/AlgR family response regulator transcription factor [Flavobacterium sp. '19STA2R22 D10 B1']|uniref:LytR/AlgR family response regulator transcription factor n=1 Tax=Flavobacterium aerium TaxID=3037261 RepID=UPI00278C8C1A|nr:LytTR family transcriptional regulator DNA-binding domain-containing protein [Flavobacterium sp. '19STA2R22 D10 B1']
MTNPVKSTYVIIDDDAKSLMNIKTEMGAFPNFVLLGEAQNYTEGINLILEHSPDLVFLEIDPMDKKSELSFGLINELYSYLNTLPKIIIITPRKDFAYEAIKHNVYDYLVKPVDRDELRKAMMRFHKIMLEEKLEIRTIGKNNVDLYGVKEAKNQIICLKSYGDYRFVDTQDIVYLKADNNSTDMIINNGDTITAFKTLKHFENTLPSRFVRIHNSYMININYVSRIHLGNAACYVKNSKVKLPFSKTYKKNVDLIISLIPNADSKGM